MRIDFDRVSLSALSTECHQRCMYERAVTIGCCSDLFAVNRKEKKDKMEIYNKLAGSEGD